MASRIWEANCLCCKFLRTFQTLLLDDNSIFYWSRIALDRFISKYYHNMAVWSATGSMFWRQKILICLFFASSDSVGWPKNLSGVACNVNVILTVILVIQNISKQGAVSVRIFMRWVSVFMWWVSVLGFLAALHPTGLFRKMILHQKCIDTTYHGSRAYSSIFTVFYIWALAGVMYYDKAVVLKLYPLAVPKLVPRYATGAASFCLC